MINSEHPRYEEFKKYAGMEVVEFVEAYTEDKIREYDTKVSMFLAKTFPEIGKLFLAPADPCGGDNDWLHNNVSNWYRNYQDKVTTERELKHAIWRLENRGYTITKTVEKE